MSTTGENVFEFVCQRLEALSMLERLESRGTIRIALKDSGLEVKRLTPAQMAVVARKVLPLELTRRGIDQAESICDSIVSELELFEDEGSSIAAPEDFVARTRAGGSR